MNTQRMPGIGAVARAQFELLLLTKYVAGLGGFLLLTVLMVYQLIKPTTWLMPWEGPGLAVLYVQLIGVGGIAGLLVWHNESPSKRRYHWAMPVRRELHDVARVIAGAAWLMVLIALFCVLVWFLEDPVARDQYLRGAWLIWASLFFVPLLSYLLITIPCIMLGRPLLMILGVITTAVIMSVEPVREAFPTLGDLSLALLSPEHPPSLAAALAGGALSAPWADPVNQRRAYAALSADWWAKQGIDPKVKAMADHRMMTAVLPPPMLTQREWLWSVVLWYVVALLGIAFAVKRRPDV